MRMLVPIVGVVFVAFLVTAGSRIARIAASGARCAPE